MPEFLEFTVDKFTFKIATDRFYNEAGVWAKEEDGLVRVGLSDYKQASNGDVAFAEVIEVGRTVQVGDAFAEIETIKVTLDLPSPITGTIIESNSALDWEAEIINHDPYDEGWLALVEPADWTADRALLLQPEAYLEIARAEAEEEAKNL